MSEKDASYSYTLKADSGYQSSMSGRITPEQHSAIVGILGNKDLGQQEPQKIELTHYQIRSLLELSESSGDPEHQDDLILQLGDEKSHSGPGLYAYFAECPEEGATFIGRDAEDQARGDAIAEERGHD